MFADHHLVLDDISMPPSAEWSPKVSDWAFFRVAAGLGYIHTAGRAHELGEGDVVAVPATATVVFRASRVGRMRLQNFHVCLERMTGLLTLPERHHLKTLSKQPGASARLLPRSHARAQEFNRIAQQSHGCGSSTLRCQLLGVFVDILAEELVAHCVRSPAVLRSVDRFERMMGEMPEADFGSRSVSELARKCGCSERHFSRLFRNHFGLSIRAKQVELRLEKARQLLLESDAKVIHIALDSGYRHLGLFNAMFKKRFGMTPTEWRRQNAKKPEARRTAANLAQSVHFRKTTLLSSEMSFVNSRRACAPS